MSAGSLVSQRIGWVDVAKGIGIILIVIGHANRSIDRSPLLVWTDELRALDTFLYSFHVPLFFVLAGVSAALARPGWRNGVHSLVLGIVVPYLIWSIIWILCKSLLPSALVNVPLDLSDLWQILWMPVDHFWFLYHLVLIRMIWLFAEHWLDRAEQWITLVLLIVASHGLRLMGEDWAFVAHFIENTAFFGFGLIVLQQLVTGISQFGRMAIVSFFAFAGLLAVNWMGDVQSLGFLISTTGALTVIFMTVYLDKSGGGVLRDGLARIGQASLVIFLLHVFAISLVRLLLLKTGYLDSEALLFWGSVAGVSLPYLAYVTGRWMSNQAGQPVMTWVGWGRWQGRGIETPA